MDAILRRYLEQPAPRPSVVPGRHVDRQLFLIPFGAAITFGIVFGSIFLTRRESWALGAFLWFLAVFVAALLGWRAHALTVAAFRNGTFTQASVVSTNVEVSSEDRTLVVTFRAALPDAGHGYRQASQRESMYRVHLTSRWIIEPTHFPFLDDAAFPMLVNPDGKHAVLFVNDEEIDAGRV